MKKITQFLIIFLISFFSSEVNAQSDLLYGTGGNCDKVVEDYLIFCKNSNNKFRYFDNPKNKNKLQEYIVFYEQFQQEYSSQQDRVMKCVDKDYSYGLRVLDCMTELSNHLSGQSSNTRSSSGQWVNCKYCHGTGKNICDKCKGNGKYNCKQCYGRGVASSPSGRYRCNQCSGSGTASCNVCYGKGSQGSCRSCDGRGQVRM